MRLTKEQAYYAAGVFENYYSSFHRIDDYLRKIKIERINNMAPALPGHGLEEDMFNAFDMHPEDMDFDIRVMDGASFCNNLEIVSSHANEKNIPGRGIFIGVYEKNTSTLVGMIRLGSSTINSKPRNLYLGKPLDTRSREVMQRFNNSAIMGFVIVPVQPFGFNYLGGKLLAGICCSRFIKEMVDAKYGSNLCMFETTSLYGTTKTVSQYDGMKPYLKYIGLTDSNFTPLLNDETYRGIYNWFVELNGKHLVPQEATSKKQKRQAMMISIVKSSLKEHDPEALVKFSACMVEARNLTERKRTYISTYGYGNVSDYLNLQTDSLERAENYERFELDNVINWWKNKAGKRFKSLKQDGRLRQELEVWSQSSELQIIR